MANEIRLRVNNISGAINDNPLLIGATVINSPNFVDLPVVDSTNHLMLILDPLELNGAAEIVRVTAHTSSNTQVTVVRAQGGSTGRQHPLGTTWFHGPVASDWPEAVTNATRPAVPYTGQIIFEHDTKISYIYTGTAWRELSAPRYAARLYRSTDLAITGGFAQTSVPMNALDWADDNAVFQGGLDYTCLIDGLYRITVNLELDNWNPSAPTILIGGGGIGEGGRTWMPFTNAGLGLSERAVGHNMTGVGNGTAGNKITTSIWNDGYGASSIREGVHFTWMVVERIGPRSDSPAAD